MVINDRKTSDKVMEERIAVINPSQKITQVSIHLAAAGNHLMMRLESCYSCQIISSNHPIKMAFETAIMETLD